MCLVSARPRHRMLFGPRRSPSSESSRSWPGSAMEAELPQQVEGSDWVHLGTFCLGTETALGAWRLRFQRSPRQQVMPGLTHGLPGMDEVS